jgi:hypothetical protein
MNNNSASKDESQKDSEKKYIVIDQYGVVSLTDTKYFIKD